MDSATGPEKVYVDSFMTEDDENKEDFNTNEAINSFIIKKDYFVMHRDGDIFKDYDVESNYLLIYLNLHHNILNPA